MADEPDPRLTPGAYISQGRRLYEVMDANATTISLENCLTGVLLSTYRESITGRASTYTLVKTAPSIEVPDTVPDDL